MMIACPHAEADSAAEKLAGRLDLAALEQAARDAPVEIPVRETVLALLDGEWDGAEGFVGWLRGQAKSAVAAAASRITALTAPMLLISLSGALIGDELRPGAEKICTLVVALEALLFLGESAGEAARAARRANALTQAAAPVLATLVSAAGGVGSAALLTPMAALAAQLCEKAVVQGTIPLCGCCAVLAVCPAFSRQFAFAGVRRFLLSLCNGAHAALITAFTALLAVRGLLTGGADSVSMRTVRYTVDSLLPVIGGEIADSLDLLVASARLVRACVGTTGCLVLAALCARPILAITTRLLALRLCAALAEPLGARVAGDVLNGLADSARALLAALASAMTLFLLIVGMAASVSLTIR